MVFKAGLTPHKNKRPCRAGQIQARMKERGLVPITTLEWAKVFRWARISYVRMPANGRSTYSKPDMCTKAREAHPKLTAACYDPFDPIYKDLGDCLFVEEWVEMALQMGGVGVHRARAGLEFLVRVLSAMRDKGDTWRKALMTTHALGGPKAVKDLLKSEGIEWN